MMLLLRMILISAAYTQVIPLVMGQHVDVWMFDSNGKIGVGEFDYENPGFSDQRVHLASFDNFYSVNNPGFTAFSGPDSLPGNKDMRWEFLPMTIDSGPHAGYRSTLLFWDGASETPAFGPTPTDDYEFSLFGRDAPAIADGGSGIVSGDVIARTPPNGALHEHRYYYLDDNGDGLNATVPEAGIYLVGLRLQIDGLEDSEPLFMVWATPEASVWPAIQPAAAWVNERVDSLYIDGIAGDFDNDRDVDGTDFLTWQRSPNTIGGANALALWENNYGANDATSINPAVVPEPASAQCFLCCLVITQLFRRGWRQRAILA